MSCVHRLSSGFAVTIPFWVFALGCQGTSGPLFSDAALHEQSDALVRDTDPADVFASSDARDAESFDTGSADACICPIAPPRCDGSVLIASTCGVNCVIETTTRDCAQEGMRCDPAIAACVPGPAVNCSPPLNIFPTFDRSCASPVDCAAEVRQVDCCGSLIVTGIAVDQVNEFRAAAAICASQFPFCECLGEPTHADDGTTRDPVLDRDVVVECNQGVCETTFPQSSLPCGSLTCDSATEVCVATAPVGPSIQYICRPVPEGCESDRSCACVAEALCASPFDSCTTIEANRISCECLECQ